MEVNNNRRNNWIIFPQNIKKYSGFIEEVRSREKNGNNNIVSFNVRIETENFKYYKNFKSRDEAEAELIRQNHENKLEIKNVIRDCGNHYKVKLPGNKNFLADKCDLHFIEAYNWYSNNNYVVSNRNGKKIRFYNLILGHTPVMNCSVDHINCNPLDNRRSNLRLANRQTQMINRNPRNMAIQPGVCLDRNYWKANWVDENNVQREINFSVKRFGYEVAKQLAISKRMEMELCLNHYRLALHNLPPLQPGDEIDDADDGLDVNEIEQGELEPNDKQGELEPNVPDEEQDEI